MTASKPMMAVSKSVVGYNISMDVIVALVFDERLGTARFLKVKHKASSNAFPIYRFPSRSLHPWALALPASRRLQASKTGAVTKTLQRYEK